MGRLLTDTSRWLLLGTLVTAPLVYGSTRAWTTHLLIGQLLFIAFSWGASCLVTRRRPPVGPALLVIGACLLLQAWWMALNAKYVCDLETVRFTAVSAFFPAAAGSIDRRLSIETALLVTGLVCVAWLGGDMASVPLWRRRALFAMAGTGALVVCLGALQRLTGAKGIYWSADAMPSFFGPYRNHDNAAAFVNLTWPLAGGLFLMALQEPRLWRRIIWGGCLVAGIAGALVSGSRAGSLVTCILLGLLTVWSVRQVVTGRLGHIRLPELIAATTLLFVIVGAIAVVTGIDFSLRRWTALEGELTQKNYRFLAYQVCLKMVPEAGWFGFGPGTFQCAFPYFTHELGDALKGRWIHAHQDYLQTVIEWGWAGAFTWAAFIGGGLFIGCAAFFKHRAELSTSRRTQFIVILLSVLGVMIHALVDFPLQIPSIQLYVCVLAGLLWASPRWFMAMSTPARTRPAEATRT